MGFDVIEATDGQQGLKILNDLYNVYGDEISSKLRLIASDIEMPLMDGFSLTKHLKHDPTLRDVPVILYSSIITDGLRHKGDSVGADDQISKPEVTQLAHRAMALIKAREQGAD